MPRLHVEDDEDQEFAESILFSAAVTEEFPYPSREYIRSLTDIITVCFRRKEQLRRRLDARGIDWFRRQGDTLTSWSLVLDETVAGLEHVEDELADHDRSFLNAGRHLLATMPVALLRWQFDAPFDCPICKDEPMTHSSGVPLPPAERLAAIMADPMQRALVEAARASRVKADPLER